MYWKIWTTSRKSSTTLHYEYSGHWRRWPRTRAGLVCEEAVVTMRAENTIELVGDDAERMQKLLDVLEDLDDVQEVFHNAAL